MMRKDQDELSSQQSSEDDEAQPHLKEKMTTKVLSPNDILGDLKDGVRTRRKIKNILSHLCFTYKIGPKKVEEALNDPNWINAMQGELNQFKRNDVWFLTKRPSDKNVITTK